MRCTRSTLDLESLEASSKLLRLDEINIIRNQNTSSNVRDAHLVMIAFAYVPFFPLIPSPELQRVDSSNVSSRTCCLLPPRRRYPGLGLMSPLALLESGQVVTRKGAGGLSGQILLNSDTRRSYEERFDVDVSATDGPMPR